MKKILYIAYGSNLNLAQMKYRCPTARFLGTGTVKNYELQFKGYPSSAFATIAPKDDCSVPVGLWELEAADEKALDRYEGYPSHYFKRNIPVEIKGQTVNAMVYIMNLKMRFGLPSVEYYHTVREGYKNCRLDTSVLDEALCKSVKEYYFSALAQAKMLSIFDMDEDEADEKFDEEPKDDEVDINDPFYYSEGMKM